MATGEGEGASTILLNSFANPGTETLRKQVQGLSFARLASQSPSAIGILSRILLRCNSQAVSGHGNRRTGPQSTLQVRIILFHLLPHPTLLPADPDPVWFVGAVAKGVREISRNHRPGAGPRFFTEVHGAPSGSRKTPPRFRRPNEGRLGSFLAAWDPLGSGIVSTGHGCVLGRGCMNQEALLVFGECSSPKI